MKLKDACSFKKSFDQPWRRQLHPSPVLLPGKSHGWRSLVDCSPQGRQELDTTEKLHFHFPLSCIGEGNGNPLQCSCLENPRDGGAWWAAVSGVAQSQTRLKQLSSSSSFCITLCLRKSMEQIGTIIFIYIPSKEILICFVPALPQVMGIIWGAKLRKSLPWELSL